MDLFELSATLRMDTSQYEQSLQRAEKDAQKASSKLGNIGKGATGAVGKVGSTAAGVVSKINGVASDVAGKVSGVVSKAGGLMSKSFSLTTGGLKGIVALSGKAANGIGAMTKLSVHAMGGVIDATGKITSGILNIGKTATATAGVASAAFAAMIAPVVKGSVSAYAEFEQLEGGIKKLFGEGVAHLVVQDAENAYKEAGISANEYLQTTTSFAAKLQRDLGGDMEQVAEITNKAIIDMADNVNTFGTDMEFVRNAYMGFSKGNFMMLDNLQLGYSGSRKEMERLLADAEKLTGRKYSIDSFADIIDAIHVIQEELHIAGTTAKEADTTIEGSMKAAKASWQNLLTEMGKPANERNIKKVVEKFSDSAKVFLKDNLIPTIQNAMTGFAEALPELTDKFSEWLPTLVEETLPDLIGTGVQIAGALVKGFEKLLFKTDWKKVFKESGAKVRQAFAGMLNLDADANWGQIRAALATKIKNGIGTIKISIAKWTGLVPENGEVSPDSVSWGAVALALGNKIWSELNGRVKFTIAKWVGLVDETTEYSADVAGDLKWADIAPKLGGAIGDAILGVSDFIKFVLAKATGVIDETTVYSAETAGGISWADVLTGIADSALGFIKGAGSAIKVTLAKLTGVIGRDTEITPDLANGLTWGEIFAKLGESIRGGADKLKVWLYSVVFHLDRNTEVQADDTTWQTIANQMATNIGQFAQNFVGSLLGLDSMTDSDWGQIAGQILKGIGNAVVGSNEFFKRLFMGDAYDKWVTEHEGNAPSWKEIVDDAWEGLQEGFGDKKLFGDLIDVGLDTLEGFTTFATNLIDGILAYLGEEGNTARIVDKVVDIVKGVMDAAPGMIDSITSFVSEFIRAITDKKNVNQILEGFKGIIDALVNNSSEITEAIWDGISNILGNPRLIEAVGHLLWQALFRLPNEIGKGTFRGVLGMLGVPKDVAETIYHVLNPLSLIGEGSGEPDWDEKTYNEGATDVAPGETVYVKELDGTYTTYTAPKSSGGEADNTQPQLVRGKTVQKSDLPADATVVSKAASDILEAQQAAMTIFRTAQAAGYDVGELTAEKIREYTDPFELFTAIRAIKAPWGNMNPDGSTAFGTEGGWTGLGAPVYDYKNGNFQNTGGVNPDYYRLYEIAMRYNANKSDATQSMTVTAGNASIQVGSADVDLGGITGAGGKTDGSQAKGLWNVPYDDYLANLHRDEMVLTASQARDYRAGLGGGSMDVVAAIQGLRNDIQHLQLVVGQKAFGGAVVDYSGKRMQGYIGRAEDRVIAGYGWG